MMENIINHGSIKNNMSATKELDSTDKIFKDAEDFYEKKHLNSDLLCVNFTELSEDEFYQCLADANRQLLDNYYKNAHRSALDQVNSLYVERDASFRGFRHSSGGTSNVNMMS